MNLRSRSFLLLLTTAALFLAITGFVSFLLMISGSADAGLDERLNRPEGPVFFLLDTVEMKDPFYPGVRRREPLLSPKSRGSVKPDKHVRPSFTLKGIAGDKAILSPAEGGDSAFVSVGEVLSGARIERVESDYVIFVENDRRFKVGLNYWELVE